MSVAPHLTKDLPYDPKKDIAPITMGVMFPNVIVVHPSVPAKTLAEYVALAKAKPGELNYATPGVGGAAHLAGELLKQRAGIDIVHVPYKGGGPAVTDVLAGRVTMYPGVPSTVKQHIEPESCARSPPPARSARRCFPTCRPSRSLDIPASRRPTGTRSSRRARFRRTSSTTGTGSS
jgi:hypothetical protein